MLLIFILMNFLIKHHLLKDKQKDPTPIKFTTSSTFFLTRASQHKISKIGITILSFSQLKLCILQDCKPFKSTYLAPFNSPIKTSQTVGFIFLSNSTLHDESNKPWFTTFGHSQLKLCILKDCKQFKSTYLAPFNSPRKTSQIVGFIFLSNTTLHDESNKIWFTPFGHL